MPFLWEIDEYYLCDLWLQIGADNEREQQEWERTRALAFNVAAYGNSDPDKMPKSATMWWPFSWDRSESVNDTSIVSRWEKLKARRDELERNKLYNQTPAP